MPGSSAHTVEAFLAGLPEDRRQAIAAIREVILRNLPPGYEEGMEFGMIGYHIPLARYPKTYNGRPLAYAALASQKSYISLYLMNVYGDPVTEAWFREEYRRTGRRLDMGKSCIRFRTLSDVPLDMVGRAIARTPVAEYIRKYEASRRGRDSAAAAQ